MMQKQSVVDKVAFVLAQINVAVSNCSSNNCVFNILPVKQKCWFHLKNILHEAVKMINLEL